MIDSAFLMAHVVFISYASKDVVVSNAICAGLEQRGIPCWIAPRDIVPGVPWAESIIDGIEGSRVMLLVFSEASNKSVQVQREVERAVHKGLSLMPVRIENVMPTRTMEYFISSQHWFDAIAKPIDQHIERLVQGVNAHLDRPGTDGDLIPDVAGAPVAPPAVPAAPAPPPAALEPSREAPLVVGNYDLTKVLAIGRFGSIVYAGEHRMLGSPVAVRVYRPTEKDNKEAIRARFLREARALQVMHPNIIHVRDFGETTELMYVVTDLLAGVSLGELVRSDGRLAIPKLTQFVRELSEATAAVHVHGGFISGLHPEIIRVVREAGKDERLAISSAGIGGMQDLLSTMNEATLRGQAAPHELSYVAPELLMGNPSDQHADVFTIGALMYYMATGRPPYPAESFPQLLGRMLMTKPPDVATERPDLGAEAAAMIMRCILPDANARFSTASDVTEAWLAAAQTPSA